MRDAGNQEMIVDVQAQTIRCGIRELIGPALLLRRAAAGASPSYPAGVFRSHLRSSRRQGSWLRTVLRGHGSGEVPGPAAGTGHGIPGAG